MLSNLKRALSGTYHAFKFFKYARRYLAETAYRFNRRFRLETLLPAVIGDCVLKKPVPRRSLRVAEVRR